MVNNLELIKKYADKLDKAIKHLNFSFNRIINLPTNPKLLDDLQMEMWESFSARFARASEIYLTKYLRAIIISKDPGFEGSFRDLLDFAEKNSLIENVDEWLIIRSLRNITAHDYTESDLEIFFINIKKYAPKLINIKIIY
ncbi:MAG: nucleotidyltransferase substrate binding protein [Oligoflexia bacterium]|nr:nucleotidyltransferase substrate binding protein [Oligoflexia bacterium]